MPKHSLIKFSIGFFFGYFCFFSPQLFSETISMVQAIPVGKSEGKAAAPQEPAPTPTISEIQLTSAAPFSTAHITIFADGHLRYEANSPENNIHENATKTITAEEFKALTELITSSHFDALQGTYSDAQITDAITYTVAVRYASSDTSKTEHVVNCTAVCPAEVNHIIKAIQELWDAEFLEIGI